MLSGEEKKISKRLVSLELLAELSGVSSAELKSELFDQTIEDHFIDLPSLQNALVKYLDSVFPQAGGEK